MRMVRKLNFIKLPAHLLVYCDGPRSTFAWTPERLSAGGITRSGSNPEWLLQRAVARYPLKGLSLFFIFIKV